MIYFDNAATTMQKPPEVLKALRRAAERFGGPGRGAHAASMEAADAILNCREAACSLFEVASPEQVILTLNATHALNLAIKSLCPKDKKVLVSGFEHNAVMRPLMALNADVIVAHTPLFDPAMALEAFKQAFASDIGLVVCTHVSNVFGTILPIEEIAALCELRQVPLIVDASQSAGVLPLHHAKIPQAIVCMPGHKGLYGPQGTGLLIVPQGLRLTPLLLGGTGSNSLQYAMPDELPDALEAGTPNAWGAAGLYEGIRFVLSKRDILQHELTLKQQLITVLNEIPRVKYFASTHHQTGVVSMVFEDADVEDIAGALSDKGVAVRAGLQCAPLAHETVGTLPLGTMRVSFSMFSTTNEVRQFGKLLKEVLKSV